MAISQTICPKCGYARKATDTAPAWQCPSCGIAYAKFAAAAAAKAAGQQEATDLRERTLMPTGQRDMPGSTALFVYGCLLIFLWMTQTQFHQFNWVKWTLLVCAVSAFLFWLSAYRRMRLVQDVPTSTIAAAAQGYVELQGTVAAAPGHALAGRLTRIPCAWHQYSIMVLEQNNKWVEREHGAHGVPFLLRDKTGECLVDAGQAEVVCNRRQAWSEDRVQYQEWSIRVGDRVHAIGHFTTGGAAAEAHLHMRTAYALASQQRDAADFAERYDNNRDGKVDAREVAAAREAMHRETKDIHTNQGGMHSLGPSPDGRPFLVIGGDQGRATTHYGWLAAAHLCVFFLALGGAAFMFLLVK